ncbi:hypothetical protein [Aeromonas sobria]|uniref:hypothetical protein n=1 Tax=Aeromonas sobria TaxID=646 RepID=UPI0026EDCD56|nr:hypothetical protein [Aeromonas sobria]
MMSMKHALMGLVLSGIGILMNRDLPNAGPVITPIDKAIRQVKRASRYRPAFNGGLPSVKQSQRQAKAKRAGRRARKLGHA